VPGWRNRGPVCQRRGETGPRDAPGQPEWNKPIGRATIYSTVGGGPQRSNQQRVSGEERKLRATGLFEKRSGKGGSGGSGGGLATGMKSGGSNWEGTGPRKGTKTLRGTPCNRNKPGQGKGPVRAVWHPAGPEKRFCPSVPAQRFPGRPRRGQTESESTGAGARCCKSVALPSLSSSLAVVRGGRAGTALRGEEAWATVAGGNSSSL